MDKNDLLINLLSYLGNIIYYPIKIYKRKIFNINKVNRILIVAYRHGIGTFVLLTPFLMTLKKNILHCEITLLVDSGVVAELAGNCPYTDKIINKKGLSAADLLTGIKYFKREMAPHKYDLVISTIYERTTRNSFWTYFSGAPYRIGFDKSVSAFLDTHTFEWSSNIHEVENYLQMLGSIGCKEIYHNLNLKISAESIEYADNFLRLNNISSKEVILGIHPGAKKEWFQKIWPLERFIEVANRFSSEFNAKIIFFGGPDEEEIFSEFARWNSNFILVNNQNIRQTQALIKRCSLFLSNDSGLMHLAAAADVPIVAIFGPTTVSKNSPWKVPHIVVRKELPCSPCYRYRKLKCKEIKCLDLINVEEVFEALCKLYSETQLCHLQPVTNLERTKI